MRKSRLTSKLAITIAGLMCLMGAFALSAETGMIGRAEGAPPVSLLPAYAAADLGDLGSSISGLSSESAAQEAAAHGYAPAATASVSTAAAAKPAPSPAPTAVEENLDPQSAAKPPSGDLNPPANLVGTFVPNTNGSYVQLNWDPNNNKGDYKTFNVYRVALPDGSTTAGPYATDKKPPYKDTDLVLGTTYRYWVVIVDKSGNEQSASNTVDVETYNVTPPSAPTGLTAFAIDPGVVLAWNANPELDISGYNLYTSSTPTGGKTRVASMIASTDYYYAAGAATLYYWVSAVNAGGFESPAAMVYPTATVPEIIQEGDPRVTTSGIWQTEHYVGPNDGKILVAQDTGASLTLSFTGSQVKVTVAMYWSCGSARIYVDGTPVASVNLYSELPTYNVVALNVPGLVHGNHTLTVEVMGSGNPSYPYNFVNVDSFEVR